MPSVFWYNEGLGVKLEELWDMLDADKFREYLAQCGAFAQNGLRNPGRLKSYRRASNQKRFEFLSEVISVLSNDDLCGVLAHAEEADRDLLYSANDGDQAYYLLYAPRYPWSLRENECKTEDEAKAYIRDLLMRFSRPEVTREKVMERIGYLSEVGISG